MTDDLELLRRYADGGSEEAFRELVQRHIDLVYAAARRATPDTHLAEDVAQSVFSDLARKAGALPAGTVLAGWLYQSARFAAAKLIRAEERRRQRESVAMELHMNAPAPDWEALRPILDEAMDELPPEDRDAVLLRYFQRGDLRTVGATLGVSDDAARKRVSRALDRLRAVLARRGLTTTAAALATTLTAHAAIPAPAGLAASVATFSLAAAAATGVSVASAGAGTIGTIAVMTKTQLAVVTAALVVAGVSAPLAYLNHRQAAAARAENDALRAELSVRPEPGEVRRVVSTQPALGGAEKEELLRLRGEVARLRAEASAVAKRPAPAGTGSGPRRAPERRTNPNRAPGFMPSELYTFAGYATPADALQSYYWALENPASGKLLESIALPPEVRARLPRRLGGQGSGSSLVTAGAGGGEVAAAGAGEPVATPGESSATRIAVMQTLDSAVAGAAGGEAVADFVSSGEGMERLSPFNGHRVVSETEIDPNTRELQVERELADGTTRLETQRLSRVGDEWKVQPGGEVQVMAMPGGGTGVMIQQGTGNGGAQLEMHVEQRSDGAAPKPQP